MTDLYVCKEGASFDFGGSPIFLARGDVARAGHPILAGREHMFEPLVVKYEWTPPPAKAKEEEKPKPKEPEPDLPVRSVRAEHQGARSR